MQNRIVIISGPSGSGKTRAANRLKLFYKCQNVVDGWFFNFRDIAAGNLILTQIQVDRLVDIFRHTPEVLIRDIRDVIPELERKADHVESK